jgi:DNA replicative helicase MCM subunit Mcm2 (Cdc46/Mcm family)
VNIKDVKNSLRVALYSLDSKTKIDGIAGVVFQKKIGIQVDGIMKNKKLNKYRRFPKNAGLESYIGKRVRLFGDISSVELGNCYVPISNRNSGVQNKPVTFCRAKIQFINQLIECVPATNESLISDFQKFRNARVMISGTAVEIPVSGRRTKAVLFVDQICESNSLLNSIQPSKEILNKARGFIEKHKEDLFLEMAKRLTKRFKIVDDESKLTAAIFPQIALLIAAGSPRLGTKCGMIHVLSIGDPGGGKSFLMKILELLLVHFQEVHGGRLTIPGFTASTKIDSSTSVVTTKKGNLPLAHRGAIYLQDVHMIRNDVFAEISHILSDQMEFGKVVIGTSANTTHLAATSVVADMNLKSRVNRTKQFSSHEDLRWETHLLSRFDLMLVIEPLNKNDETIGRMSQGQLTNEASFSTPEDDIIFKTIIALLHEMIPAVNMNAVIETVNLKLKAFYNDNSEICETVEFDSSFNRLHKSLAKIITAHARLKLRSEANDEDVTFAMNLIRLKFNTLKMLVPAIKTRTLKASYLGPVETRQRWIMSQYQACSFHSRDVTKAYEDYFPDSKVDERTIKRDLEQIAEPLGKGIWRLPTQNSDVKNVNFDKNDIKKSTNTKSRDGGN